MSQRALLVGINNFATLPDNPLRGCINDTVQIHGLLTRHYGFDDDCVRILRDGDATADGIVAGLGWLLSDYDGHDVRVFHFSSHGTQVSDQGTDEYDAADEVIVPADHDWDRPFRDDHLKTLFDAIPPEVNFTYIADCCHSGTISKDVFDRMARGQLDVRPRFLTPPPAIMRQIEQKLALREEAAPEQSAEALVQLLTSGAMGVDEYKAYLAKYFARIQNRLRDNRYDVVSEDRHFVVAACQDRQTAADAFIEGDYHGALTWALCRAATEANGDITYGELVGRISSLLADYDQRPQLECPSPALNTRLFAPLA